jgi:hypothetical protein
MSPIGSFHDRKERELKFKLASLPMELGQWRIKAQTHEPLAKNHSQITRVILRMEGFQNKVESELQEAVQQDELWKRAGVIETKALLLHMVWDFFRTRFSLRTVSPFDRYLALADAFGRACYEPAVRHLKTIPATEFCPAPLITFNDQISPWSSGADAPAPESGPDGVTVAQLTQAINSMPLALIGVPWSYLTYLPHMALLAHEVGHAVEQDGGLTDAIAQAAENANLATPERKPAWQSWAREVFADVFACWTAGPAFVWALADYLAAEQSSIARQVRPQTNGEWTKYPTATLRVRFGCYVLEQRGFTAQAKAIRDAWSAAYPQKQLANFEEDFGEIASRFAAAAQLPATAPMFDPAQFAAASLNARLLAAGANLGNSPETPQCYITTARLLMLGGLSDSQMGVLWEKVVAHHLDTRSPELAGAKSPEPTIDEDAERREGARLADLL